MSFSNKVVLVTGASSGIGRGAAEEFAKQHALLAITGRNVTALDEVAKHCLEIGAKDVLRICLDFSEQSKIAPVIDKVVEKFGHLDILINNAGTLKSGNLMTSTAEDFDHHFNVNVKAMFLLTQKAMPHLISSKGNIVNVSSLAGSHSFEGLLLYGMSKAAVDQFTKTIARECAPKGVRVNSVNPAVVKTDIRRLNGATADQMKQYYEGQLLSHPLGRLGTVEEVAKAILFLASDDSAWTTGVNFLIDGGRALAVLE